MLDGKYFVTSFSKATDKTRIIQKNYALNGKVIIISNPCQTVPEAENLEK